jgi:hypothetical protein
MYSSNRTWRWLRRKLTATGRIGLADARQLVELLGTGDTIDPEIGGRVFTTRSSEDLAHLSRIGEWAKAARLVRASGIKLMPVKKNAALAERPLDLVLALLEAYPGSESQCFPEHLAPAPRRRSPRTVRSRGYPGLASQPAMDALLLFPGQSGTPGSPESGITHPERLRL